MREEGTIMPSETPTAKLPLDFRNIAFGHSSAEAERTNDPGLLLEGHIDFKAASDEALHGNKFLFLARC
jgi:hypothetical protein